VREKEYTTAATVEYAKTWALLRNPRYFDFDPYGGDCTNFASQCVYAGSGVMNYSYVTGWYFNSSYDRSPSWTSVMLFHNFLISNQGVGPYGVPSDKASMQLGDLIQLGDMNGRFYHSLIVCGFEEMTYLFAVIHTILTCGSKHLLLR
jgi:hypothetical protein